MKTEGRRRSKNVEDRRGKTPGAMAEWLSPWQIAFSNMMQDLEMVVSPPPQSVDESMENALQQIRSEQLRLMENATLRK